MGRTEATLALSRRIELQGGVLEVALKDGAKVRATIGKAPIILGRDPSCDFVVPDKHVSAVHAELIPTERGVRLRDLGSRNGTWVGGIRITEAYLVDSSPLVFGELKATFEAGDPARFEISPKDRFGALYGKSQQMRVLFTKLATLAPTDLTVLILGETGTGKELVAQGLHEASARKKKPFIVVDCGALTPTLAEALLFGHERGAFTGATSARTSPFIEADGGTVFLDELGELPLEVQPKLLRALAERRVQAVGGRTYKPFDARVIAATRRDLPSAAAEGSFRSDLYFRVAQARVELPALRERADDLPGLVKEILTSLGAPRGAASRVSRETMERLLRHDWPGNIRELRNAVAAGLAFAEEGGAIEIADHVAAAPTIAASSASYHDAKKEALARFERGYFAMIAAEHGGNVAEIARHAGLQRAHVRRYMKAHGLLLPRSERRRRS